MLWHVLEALQRSELKTEIYVCRGLKSTFKSIQDIQVLSSDSRFELQTMSIQDHFAIY